MRLALPRSPFLWLGLFTALGLAAAGGLVSFWTDSEMWPVAATKYFLSDRIEYYFLTKPLFHYLLYLNQIIAQSLSVHPMDTARAFMILNTLGLSFAVILILRRFGSLSNAVLGTLCLFGISFFVKRGGQVRSDIIVAHLLLWLLYLELLGPAKFKGAARWALAVTAVLISPKAILELLCFWPFYRDYLTKRRFLIGCGLALVGLLVSLALPGLDELWRNPATFFLNSFLFSETGIEYWDQIRFVHVFRLMYENPHFIVALIYSYLFCFPSKFSLVPDTDIEKVRALSISMIVLLAIYPDRLPFFIAGLLPFFVVSIFCTQAFQNIFWSPGNRSKYVAQLVAGMSFILALHWTLKIFGAHSSKYQRLAAEWIQHEINLLPEIEIYDPSGILPTSRANYWFLGPGQVEKNRHVINYILQRKPEVILFSAKLFALEPRLFEQLNGQYSGDGSGIFVRKILILEPPLVLLTKILRQDLEREFPRLAKRPDIEWRLHLRDRSGIEVTQSLKWESFEKAKTIQVPPNLERITILPFQINLPYSSNLTEQFRFDAEF